MAQALAETAQLEMEEVLAAAGGDPHRALRCLLEERRGLRLRILQLSRDISAGYVRRHPLAGQMELAPLRQPSDACWSDDPEAPDQEPGDCA
jgi:hypothetical protein